MWFAGGVYLGARLDGLGTFMRPECLMRRSSGVRTDIQISNSLTMGLIETGDGWQARLYDLMNHKRHKLAT